MRLATKEFIVSEVKKHQDKIAGVSFRIDAPDDLFAEIHCNSDIQKDQYSELKNTFEGYQNINLILSVQYNNKVGVIGSDNERFYSDRALILARMSK